MATIERGQRRGRAMRIKEMHPTPQATSKRYPTPPGAKWPEVERESHAIRCAQCGFPVEDSRINECPHCGSDNMLGFKFPKER